MYYYIDKIEKNGGFNVYHVQLHIYLHDVNEDIANVFHAILAPTRFTLRVHEIAHISDIPDELPDGEEQLIIARVTDRIAFDALCAKRKERSMIVLYDSEDVLDALSEKDLDCMDDIWEAVRLPHIAAYRCKRLLSHMATRKEAWLRENYLQTTINTLPDLIWYKDIEGLHLEINDAFCLAVNKEKEDIRGKDHYSIWDISKDVYENSDYVCVETEDDVITARKTCLFDEEVMKADGTLRRLKTYKTPIFDGDTIIGTVGIARDVTTEYEYLHHIKKMAREDHLTGLANRHCLDLYLGEITTSEMVVLYCDLDFFKQVNDTYGHQMGDAALVMTAGVIKCAFPDAFNVRIGGDEFISIFTDGVDMTEIPARVQAFIDTFLERCKEQPQFQKLSISAGIAVGKIGHGSFDLLLQKADRALYQAKQAGRGRYFVET